MNSTVLGLIAGVLTTGAWLPQILRVSRLRRAEEISWGYLLVLAAGISCWLGYGIVKHDISIILANAATLVFVFWIVGLKLVTRERDAEAMAEA